MSGCAQLTAYVGTTISVNNFADINVYPALKVGSTMVERSAGNIRYGTL